MSADRLPDDVQERILLERAEKVLGELGIDDPDRAEILHQTLARWPAIRHEAGQPDRQAYTEWSKAPRSSWRRRIDVATALALPLLAASSGAIVGLSRGWLQLLGFAVGLPAAIAQGALQYRRDERGRRSDGYRGIWADYLIRLDAVVEQLIVVIRNERDPRNTARGTLLVTDSAPTLVEIDNYPDAITSAGYRRLAEFVREHRTSAIGLAGPRGAGKTTAMHMLIGDPSVGAIGVHLNTPVARDAADIVRLIELALGESILRDANISTDRFPPLFGTTFPRALRLALTSVWPIVLGLALVVVAVDNAGTWWPKAHVRPWSAAAGLVAGIALLVIAWRMLRSYREYRRGLAKASEVARIAFDRVMDLKWQAAIKRTSKGGWNWTPWSAEQSREVAHSERARTHAENVARLRTFMQEVNQRAGRPVVVCVDELDKIADGQQAIALVNALKDVMHVSGTHLVVSVSTDAMHSFAARGIPLRDVFDSSLDAVIEIGCLAYADSTNLLNRRVLYFPRAAIAFCHIWSGGHARDLVRAARAMVEVRRRAGADVPVSTAVRDVLHHDVAEVLAAAIAVTTEADAPLRKVLVGLLLGLRKGDSMPEPDRSAVAGTLSPGAVPVLAALPAYLRLAAALETAFGNPQAVERWGAAEVADVAEAADRLAGIRWTLANEPLIAETVAADGSAVVVPVVDLAS